ncbi:MAG: hypothetical protein DHS20C18_01120 [Saprospiraceae bacterium]|nr:MAG: hypothetical protein DHS20C18_01120 [Saprospiraceae bacterium]
MKPLLLFGLFTCVFLLSGPAVQAQCEVAIDEVDPFDSTRVVGSHPVNFGYMIPSKYELTDGPKMIEEGKMLFAYSENDSINGFFMTFAIQEYSYEPIETGHNVQMKLSDGEVLAVYNIPDNGTFDKTTNMRLYQHTCVIPLDLFYRLTFSTIEMIRIEYQKQNRIIVISEKQQKAIRAAVQCVGRKSGLYPVKP